MIELEGDETKRCEVNASTFASVGFPRLSGLHKLTAGLSGSDGPSRTVGQDGFADAEVSYAGRRSEQVWVGRKLRPCLG